MTEFLSSPPDATWWQTIHMQQRDREAHDLGYRDLGGES